MAFGTLQITDTLAAQRTLIADYGEDNAYKAIEAYRQAHNAIMQDMLMDLAEPTQDRLRRFGGVASMKMQRANEYSRPNTQKVQAGVNVGFPLELYQVGLQWTRKWFQTHVVADLESQVNAVFDADLQRVILEIQRAIFVPTNNLTYTDYLVDDSTNITLPILALLNADGLAIPADPWGNTFNGASHTHYIATATFIAANLTSLIQLVQEHYSSGTIRVYVNQADEQTVRGFSGFSSIYDARLVVANNITYAAGTLDIMNVYNRKIGIFGAAEIWVKPWIPVGYAFAFNPQQRKPLALRTRGTGGGLELVFNDEDYPLRCEFYERELGLGVQERTNGAVLRTNNGTYAAPSLAA